MPASFGRCLAKLWLVAPLAVVLSGTATLACPRDLDLDGYCDAVDNCPTVSDSWGSFFSMPPQLDSDFDGLGDLCDCDGLDADGDGVCEDLCHLSFCWITVDNCPTTPNRNQADANGDGDGDVCDVCFGNDATGDSDADGICTDRDNCEAVANPGQEDGDFDGRGDACGDVCVGYDSYGDDDSDGFCEDLDNCSLLPNPDQGNFDQDYYYGDACDSCTDGDADGFGDPGFSANTCPTDNCPVVRDANQTDADGDGIGDVCEGVPIGSDRILVTPTRGYQTFPYAQLGVAMAPSGNFMVSWAVDSGADYSLAGKVVARVYDSGGAPLGPQFVVEGTASYGDNRPVGVAPNGGNGFVAVWKTDNALLGRLFDSTGNPEGPAFEIAPGEDYGFSSPDVAGTPNGFVVVWDKLNGIPAVGDVLGRRFGLDGSPLGPTFVVNTHTPDYQFQPAIAADPAGNFVVSWTSYEQDGSDFGVVARRFSATGSPLTPEIPVNTFTVGNQGQSYYEGGKWQDVASAPDGDFVVLWGGQSGPAEWGFRARRFDATGVATGSEFSITSEPDGADPLPGVAAAGDGSGGFSAVWYGRDATGDALLQARQFDAGDIPRGRAVAVVPSNDPNNDDQIQAAAIASDADGDFVVVWRGYTFPSYGSYGERIFARRFTHCGNGTVDGGEQCDDGALNGGFSCCASDCTLGNPAAPDADGDGDGDLCDLCPSDPENTCDTSQTTVRVVDDGGGTLATPDGSVQIDVPPGALGTPTPLSITSGLENSDFGVSRGARDALLVDIEPDGTSFSTPVTLTFKWPDANDDGEVDGFTPRLLERRLRVWKDGNPITGECGAAAHQAPACDTACGGLRCCCDRAANTWTLQVTSLSEFFVGRDLTPVGIPALKLVLVDKIAVAGKAKAALVAKDPAVTKGLGTDVAGVSARVEVAYADGRAGGAFSLPAGASNGTAGWLVNSGTVAKYVNRQAPAGPTGAKVALVKPGKLVKLAGKDLGDEAIDIHGAGAPLGAVHTAFCIETDGDETCHCSEFGSCSYKQIAGGTGAKLVCKNGVSDTTCLALGPPAPSAPPAEDLTLDSSLGGPVTTAEPLAAGQSYRITVSGTYVIWGGESAASMCGLTTESLTPSPSTCYTPTPIASQDVEWFWAAHLGGPACPSIAGGPIPVATALAGAVAPFEMSLDGGTTWIDPTPTSAAYSASHTYEYVVTGTGNPAAFRIVDGGLCDNNGLVAITVAAE